MQARIHNNKQNTHIRSCVHMGTTASYISSSV